MNRSKPVLIALAIAMGACSSAGETGPGGGHGGGGAGGGPGGSSGSGGSGGDVSTATLNPTTGTGVPGCDHDPSVDGDGDGWSAAEGDCNDCDPNSNPGAVEVIGTTPDGEGGLVPADEDCDGEADEVELCDDGLAVGDTSPMSAAKAIDLCQVASANDKKWGVLAAKYTRAAPGAEVNPGLQAGIFEAFGDNVHVQRGKRMLGLSSGRARTPATGDVCGNNKCTESGVGVPPPGFPQDVPSCETQGLLSINDDVAFEVQLRAPTNATGYRFSFKFYSSEFPYFVCTKYNDQFIAVVFPQPAGSIKGNIAFDANKNPVSVNIGFFDVCDPTTIGDFAGWCEMTSVSCPDPPDPYCPSGATDLAGTGFDTWGFAGATSWLQTTAPVTGGEELDIRFAIWDTGDTALDSTVIIDGFEWIAESGTVPVGTTPIREPK